VCLVYLPLTKGLITSRGGKGKWKRYRSEFLQERVSLTKKNFTFSDLLREMAAKESPSLDYLVRNGSTIKGGR